MTAAITHVLLDLDGTLTDSEPGIVGSLRHAFVDFGLGVPAPELLRTAIGPPLELVLPVLGVPDELVWPMIERYRERYDDVGLFENRLYDGVVEMLDALVADGLVLAVATAKPQVVATRIVRHFGLAWRLAAVGGATAGPGRRTKADVIAYTLGLLGVDPGPHVVMVGDRDHDVLGARAHGLDGVGVTWGFGSRDELGGAGAVALVDSPGELVSWVAARTAGRVR